MFLCPRCKRRKRSAVGRWPAIAWHALERFEGTDVDPYLTIASDTGWTL